MRLLLSLLIFCITLTCSAQTDSIKEVKIGEQIWMAENLSVDRFQNGDIIKEAKTKEDWKRAEANRRPAWCYYSYDSANGAKYGKLYNRYAVDDPRGLAPKKWHIADAKEWETLFVFLGGEKKAGKKMKSTEGWKDNGHGNNSSGFNGLPGGACYCEGNFYGLGEDGYWWKGRYESLGYYGDSFSLNYSTAKVSNSNNWCHMGYYVRCIKNK